MTSHASTSAPRHELLHEAPSSSALQVLEAFALSANLRFDRIHARRMLGEAERAIAGNDVQAWSRRLVEVGDCLSLRVRYLECSVDDALTFVRQRVPVAFCEASATTVQWYLLDNAKKRKVRLSHLGQDVQSQWVTSGQLIRRRGLASSTDRTRWVIGQAALACQAPDRSASRLASTEKLTPLARLFNLIRPEKKDLWVVVIFSLVVGVLALATPIAVEALVNTVAFGRYLQPVVVLSLLLFTCLAFAAAIRGLLTYVVEVLQRRLFIRVVEDLAYRLPRVRHEEFDRAYGPELTNRFFDVVTLQKTASALLLDGVSIVLQTTIGMAVLAFYHPFLLGFDVVLLGLIAFAIFALGRGSVRTAIKESKMKYAVAAWLEQLAQYATAFKLHAGSQFALERADQLAINWLEARRSHFRIVLRQILFALGLQAVAATALLGLGGWLVIQGELTLGQLVAAELIVMMIVGSFAKLGKHMESFYDLLASVDKLGVLFDLKIENRDHLFHIESAGPASMTVRDGAYSYGGKQLFSNFSLQLAPREAVALGGRPGVGKSTLIDMISGLRRPSGGHIELDGIDLREIGPDSLREHLSVARGVEIFHGSVEENIHLNRSNLRASDVRQALECVDLLDELLALPDGLNTVLQSSGSPLSKSQAYRLMLARAIVGRPRLLIIDGTLDPLSDETAAHLMERLTASDAPWTLLVVSNRSTIRDACDRVATLG